MEVWAAGGRCPNSEGVGPLQTGKTQCLGLIYMKYFMITQVEKYVIRGGRASEDVPELGAGGEWGCP